jgi:hypothetical protein
MLILHVQGPRGEGASWLAWGLANLALVPFSGHLACYSGHAALFPTFFGVQVSSVLTVQLPQVL